MSIGTDRVEKLRQHAVERHLQSWKRGSEGELLWYRGWMDGRDAASSLQRQAWAKGYMLRHATPVIDEGELIAGKPCYRELSAEERQELEHDRACIEKAMIGMSQMDAHMAVDYEKLLHMGISGVQQEITQYRNALNLELPEDLEKDDFYASCLETLDALAAYADRYAELAEVMAAGTSDLVRKSELKEISRICRKVPRYPADTFYEALQSIHFLTFSMEGLYQLGRPDRYLIEYYRRDVQKGILSREQAQELIDCLCILFNEYIPAGLAVGLMVGGRDAAGRDVCNELTELFIESIGHTRMIYPSIGLCCTSDTPRTLLEKSAGLLAEGNTHPALFNDDVIVRGLQHYGLPIEEACLYIHSTCVEITPIASSAVWVASPYINLVQPLLDQMSAGGDTGKPQPENFDLFKEEYRVRLGKKIRLEAIDQNRQQMERARHGGDPLVSCFVKDCLARGKDMDQGGARYNWIMPSFVGLANLVDSFVTIRRLVYEEKRYTTGQLSQILKENFADCENLRMEIVNRIPKYGNDQDEVDKLVQEVTGWIIEETGKYVTYRGDKFIPSLFCWIMHERLGSETMASPDGRISGFPLGDGSGPAQGRERKGPTASILSSTKWEHAPFIGGIAVNMKFGKSLFEGESLHKMLELVRTFMERGGFELQVNVVDRDTLLKARENPEAYQDLVVRVGGYSDYFVHLTPAMQEEVILRTEHQI